MRWPTVLLFSFVVAAVGCGPTSMEVKDSPVEGEGGLKDPEQTGAGQADQVLAGMGIMVGEVTSSDALVQVRLTRTDHLVDRDVLGADGVVEFSLRPDGEAEAEAKTITVHAGEELDFIARAAFGDLTPGTAYVCETRIGADGENLAAGPVARFKTLPGAEQAKETRFVVVTGMNYAKFHGDDRIDKAQHLLENNTKLPTPYAGPDKDQGYPALEAILSMKPDFLIGTGDNVYYDTPDDPRAETIAEMRQKWNEQYIQPRYVKLFANVPTYWEIDDHDYRIDDGDNTGDHKPTPEDGRRMMLEQLPVAPHDDADAKTYRTHRVSRDLQIWLPENRMYRSANLMPDGPEKTIWGIEQKQWLMETLEASDATFKLLISPTPMIGPDDMRKTDNHTNIGGFQHERDAFFAWLAETGLDKQNFYILCGDRHWQYHSVHPAGIEEFSCGALIDANSRLGRKPGDPTSTAPEGLNQQPSAQEERSGGFVLVQVRPAAEGNPAQLTLFHHDEAGELLHQTVKPAN
ncbi:MAG: alkaline phosphatase family protein [Planctomycetales bacterium]